MPETRLLFLLHDSIYDRYGGVQYYLHDFVRLSSIRFGRKNVNSLALKRSAKLRQATSEYQIDFVPIENRGIFGRIRNRFPANFCRRAIDLVNDFKPNWIINSHVSLGPVSYLVGKRTGVPVATIVYGTDCWGDLFPQDEWCLRKSKRIFSISHWTKKVLVERGYNEGKIKIVHPLLPEFYESFSTPKSVDRDFTLASVSRLEATEQYKGQDHTLRALAKIKRRAPKLKFRYLIVGEGSDKPRLQSIVKDFGLDDSVEFLPALDDREKLKELYSQIDLFVMPSRFGRWEKRWRGEGFGIVYVEAAACGVPSVAYDCGGVTDIVAHQKTGLLVEPDNIEALSHAIESVLVKPERARELGRRARAHVLDQFGSSQMIAQIEKATR